MKPTKQLGNILASLVFLRLPSSLRGQTFQDLYGDVSPKLHIVQDPLPYDAGLPTPPLTFGTIFLRPDSAHIPTLPTQCYPLPDGTEIVEDLAFNSVNNIFCIDFPASVRSIGAGAFARCPDLVRVSIPDGVTFVNFAAFSTCPKLVDATIGAGLTKLPPAMFRDCFNLSTVTIPNSVIGFQLNPGMPGTFENCSALKAINLPNSLTNIGHNAFYGSGLTHITIPGSVQYIGALAFQDCANLATVTIEPGVKSLDWRSFYGCLQLATVTIPSSVTNIGSLAFAQCTNLSRVYFEGDAPPDLLGAFLGSPTTVYYKIGTTGWENAKILAPVIPLVPEAFSDFTIEVANNVIAITGYKGPGGAVTIPGAIGGLPVTRIGREAFAESAITSLTISDSVEVIDFRAFYNCQSLTNVTFGKSVGFISFGAFQYCSGLTTLALPDRVWFIGNVAFSSCTSLTYVTIGSSLKVLDLIAFAASPLSSVYFKNLASSISSGGGIKWPTTVYYPISKSAPDWPTNFPGATLMPWDPVSDLRFALTGESLAITGYGGSHRSLTLPSEFGGYPVTSIAPLAFQNHTLTNVTIPNSISALGDGAFSGCDALTRVFFLGNAPTLGGASVFTGTPSGIYYIPGTTGWGGVGDTYAGRPAGLWTPAGPCVLGLSNGAISIAKYLGSGGALTIPSSIGGYPVTTIGRQAFGLSELTSLTLPASVTSLEDLALASCKTLQSVYCQGNAPELKGIYSFAETPATIYRDSAATGWGEVGAQFAYRPTALWNPVMQTSGAGFGVKDNTFRIEITGPPNLRVVVEASSDPANPVWQPLLTETLTNGSLQFSDPDWPTNPRRYYRIRLP